MAADSEGGEKRGEDRGAQRSYAQLHKRLAETLYAYSTHVSIYTMSYVQCEV